MTTARRLFSFFHNGNGNIKWLHDIETHLQNLLAYKTQLLITFFNINIMIFLGMCQKCSQYNNILIHNILVPFLEWIIITIFTSLLFIYYDTYARKVFQNSYSFLCSLSSQVQKFVDFLQSDVDVLQFIDVTLQKIDVFLWKPYFQEQIQSRCQTIIFVSKGASAKENFLWFREHWWNDESL